MVSQFEITLKVKGFSYIFAAFFLKYLSEKRNKKEEHLKQVIILSHDSFPREKDKKKKK